MSPKKAQCQLVSRWIFCLLCLAVVCPFAKGDTQYYKHTLFDNSLEPDAYYYSSGKAASPSTLELIHGKLPVSHDFFYTPPNALRLKWRSVRDGGWEAGISAINFRNREIDFQGDTLFLWCFSKEGIPASALPLIQISDTGDNFSILLPLGKYVPGLSPGTWVQVQIPLEEFKTASIHDLQVHRLNKVVFAQGESDSAEHTLVVDELMVDDRTAASSGRPVALRVSLLRRTFVSRDMSVMSISAGTQSAAPHSSATWCIARWRAATFSRSEFKFPEINRYADYLGKAGQSVRYKVAASDHPYNRLRFRIGLVSNHGH